MTVLCVSDPRLIDLHSNTIFLKFPTFINNNTTGARTSEVGAIIFWNVSKDILAMWHVFRL